MLVTERLASLFIKENLEDRAVLADATSQFLDSELEDARRRLVEKEKAVEAYRRQHQGSLPTELQTNLQSISSTQIQLQTVQASLGREQDRRVAIEQQVANLRAEAAVAPAPAAADPGGVTGTAAQRLEAARKVLSAAEMRLKPEHPDILRIKRAIKDLEKEAEAEALQSPLSGAPQPQSDTPADVARRARISELVTEHGAVMRRIAAGQAEEQRLKGLIAMYQRRVEETPARESEMVSLMRDYETLKTIYTGLLTKNESSKVAANLERRQIGEQFRILDGARLPEKPISPNRTRTNVMGAGAGLVLGLALVALVEYKDTSLKCEDDVIVALALPVLALVPSMVSQSEERLRNRRRLLMASMSIVLVLAAAATAVWKLRVLERWVR